MLKSVSKFIEEWNTRTSERTKLQHSYVVLAVASILVAGLIGLVNYDMGQRLVAVALICGGVFLVNALVWALLSGLVLVRLQAESTTKPQKTTAVAKSSKRSNK